MSTIKIIIEKLNVHTFVGIEYWEKLVEQPLIFDIEMEVIREFNIDDITETIDYTTVSNQVIEFCKDNQYSLLETLVECLVGHLLSKHSLIKFITIKASKPMAIKNAANAIIIKSRSQYD